jgi:hypothetical protein
MSVLKTVRSGRELLPPRIVLYGTEGVGKSTFGASAPAPVFVPTEDGLGQLDCARFPLAESLQDVLAALAALYAEPHDYRTVVVDILDWLERPVFDELCRRYEAASVEKGDGGYGKGYVHALGYWRRVLAVLDRLRLERGMAVVCIAHAKVERFEDPEASAYDRHAPRLHKHAAALVCEWADAVLFAGRKVRVRREDAGFNRTRGIATAVGHDGGERVLRTVGGPGCVAKNRYCLPPELPLSWPAFVAAMTASQPQPSPDPVLGDEHDG